MKGICNLTGKTYIIEPRNLKELAKYFIEKYNLTVEDISSFYREKSTQIRYDGYNETAECLNFDREIKERDRDKIDYTITSNGFRYTGDELDIVGRFAQSLFKRPLEDQINDIKVAAENGEILYRFLGCEKIEESKKEFGIKLYSDTYNRYYQILSLDDAVQYFKEGHHEILLCQNDTVEAINNLKYECDFSPIVCNLNVDVTDKNGLGDIQLIDGFKRLFTNKLDRLDFEAPVKTYINLSDEEYLRVLNACNGWKYKTPRFYDRGYIFSLQNRFNINLVEFNKNQYNIDLVSALTLYGENIPFYEDNKYFISDLELIRQLLTTPTPIDPKIEIMNKSVRSMIQWLGQLRSYGLEDQIDFLALWNKILTDNAKLFKKKINSTSGWADNFVRDNITILIRNCIKETAPEIAKKMWILR